MEPTDPNLSAAPPEPIEGVFRKFAQWLSWHEESLFLFLAVIIGIVAGLAVVAFRIAIDRTHILLFGPAPFPTWPRVVLIPSLVGLVVAVLVMTLFRRAFDHVKGLKNTFLLVKYSDGEWVGVTAQALQDAAGERKGGVPLREILSSTRLPLLHPDQPLDFALRQIGDWPLLPVVSRADFSKLVGVISIEDILRAYRGAGKR